MTSSNRLQNYYRSFLDKRDICGNEFFKDSDTSFIWHLKLLLNGKFSSHTFQKLQCSVKFKLEFSGPVLVIKGNKSIMSY